MLSPTVDEPLQIALEGSHIVLFTQDLDLRYTWIFNPPPNHATDEVIGRRDEELFEPDDAAVLSAIKRRVLSTGHPARETVRTSGQGIVAYYDLVVEPMRDESGVVIGITCAATDTTVHAQRADELRFQTAVLETITDAVIAVDLSGWILYWNSGAEALFGYSAAEMLGQSPGRLFPEEERASFPTYFATVSDGRHHSGEWRALHKSGASRWVEMSARTIRDSEGATTGVVGVGKDITERKQSEERLREAERTLRLIIEQSPAVLFRTRPARLGGLLYVSPQISDLLGITPEECLDDPCDWYLSMLHPDDRERVLAHEQRIGEVGAPYVFEYRFIARSGHIVWVRDEGRLVRDEAGTPLYWQGLWVDITAQKQLETDLQRLAFHDALTGLPNRALLADRIERAIAASQRLDETIAVVFIDVDHLKVINDSLGHSAGDELLMGIAERLLGSVREEDTVSRFGGDEFVVLLTPLRDAAAAVEVVERILQTLQEPLVVAGRHMTVTASVGIVLPLEHADAETLLWHADAAMYRAKAGGRNRYEIFDHGMHQDALKRLTLEHELRQAITKEQLRLVYQPEIDVVTGHIRGLEALLRWPNPTHLVGSPAEFISLAEETGLIVPIGEWVIREACQQMAMWNKIAEECQRLTLSVNVSAKQFEQDDIVEQVVEILAESSLPASSLTLEVTETAIVADAIHGSKQIRRLRSAGLTISVDDFGTGYSSLSYLKQMPLDVLKIDRSFVDGLGTEPEDTAIVEAIIAMARALGIRVVAEGVETPEQLDALRQLGCDSAQGFLFWPPLQPDDVTRLLIDCYSPSPRATDETGADFAAIGRKVTTNHVGHNASESTQDGLCLT